MGPRRRLRALSAHVCGTSAEAALLPLRVGPDFHPLPSELARVHAALDDAAVSRDFRRGAALQDLLHVVEPKAPLTVDECCPDTPEECLNFFLREGFVCVRELFPPDALRGMQAQWRRAQAPIRALWEEAKLTAGNFIGEDFTPEPRFAHIPHGRLWFDLPLPTLFGDADDGPGEMLDVIDPPRLVPVLEEIVGPDVQLVGIQPRTVPPEQNQGYTSWHRVRSSPAAPLINHHIALASHRTTTVRRTGTRLQLHSMGWVCVAGRYRAAGPLASAA